MTQNGRTMRLRLSWFAAALGLCTYGAQGALVQGGTTDVERNEDNTLGFAGATFRAGASTSSGGGRNGIFVFDLTAFSGQTFSSADVGLTLATISGTPAFNVDLYGVGYGTSASAFPPAADYYEGIFNGDVSNVAGLVGIQDNFVPASNPLPANNRQFTTNAAGDATLLTFLNARPAGQNFVFFRVTPDVDAGAAAPVGYNFHSADATTADFRPQLGLNQQVPEPASAGLLLLGTLGLLTRRARRPEPSAL